MNPDRSLYVVPDPIPEETETLVGRIAFDLTAKDSALGNLVAHFRRYLYMPDPIPLVAVLSTVVANHLDGDPVWLVVVGPPSSGKTEILNSLANLKGTHMVSQMTRAGMLSGSPGDGDGGLLQVLGEKGLIVLKDLTTLLSEGGQNRAELLAMLREIYDGQYARRLGTGGGRTVAWKGKAGLIGAVTETIDSHSAVMGAMGERFVLVRMPHLDDAGRLDLLFTAASNVGRTDQLRDDLAGAVKSFLNGLSLPEAPVGIDDPDRLAMLADFAARTRSAVERGVGQEITLVPQSEVGARIQGVLYQLWRGAMAIGAGGEVAWEVVTRAALDSTPKLRTALIRALLAQKGRRMIGAEELGDDLGYSTGAATRALEDLAAHGLVKRSSLDPRNPLWEVSSWCVERWAALGLLVPEKSE